MHFISNKLKFNVYPVHRWVPFDIGCDAVKQMHVTSDMSEIRANIDQPKIQPTPWHGPS